MPDYAQMPDRGRFWTSGPELFDTPVLTARLLRPAPMLMISGDLAAARACYALPAPGGLLSHQTGETYALRLSRDRMLIIGHDLPEAEAGWDGQAALTPMPGAYAIVALDGPAVPDLLARSTAVDLDRESPSAAIGFAGITALLCRHDTGTRLHVERGLAPYLIGWVRSVLAARGFMDEY